MKYILDTNIINRLVDGTIQPDHLPSNVEFVATHIQIEELNKTIDAERRVRLLLKFGITVNTMVPTETFVIGSSRIEHAKIGEGLLYETLKRDLDALNNKKKNNTQDALIAEVAIINGYTLVTADFDLSTVAKRYSDNVMYFVPPAL